MRRAFPLLLLVGACLIGAGREFGARARPAPGEAAEGSGPALVTISGDGVEILHAPGENAARQARALLERRQAASKRMAARLAALAGERARADTGARRSDGLAQDPARARAGQAAIRPMNEAVGTGPGHPVRFVLYPSLEAKMTSGRNTEEAAAARERPDLVPVVAGGDPALEDLAQARALARGLLAGAALPGLEWGLAVHLNGSWKGQPAAAVSARLAAAGVLPGLSRIFAPPAQDPRNTEVSPLLLGPAAGNFVDFVVARMGASAFLAAARGAAPGTTVARELAAASRSRAASQTPASGLGGRAHESQPREGEGRSREAVARSAFGGGQRGGGERRRGEGDVRRGDGERDGGGGVVGSQGLGIGEREGEAGDGVHGAPTPEEDAAALARAESAWRGALPAAAPPPSRAPLRGFFRGVCLAHTNSPSGGYGSEALSATLAQLASDGVEWISITPFAYQRTPSSTGIWYVLDGSHNETDEALRHVIRAAHGRGLKVLYNPHLWVGHGNWCGEIEMKSEDDWAAWFEAYRAFIVHHALLAEEERADLFCVANEMVRTAGRSRQWRETIAALRRVFGGPLTYAANWGEEAEKVDFWDALDFVSISAYYPLSNDPARDDPGLAEGAARIAERLAQIGRRTRRPILLTEIGFAARPGCWVDPHLEIESAAVDLACQERAYAAVLKSFGEEPFRGLFWWKYESDPSIGGADDNSFTPRGKPAEKVMAESFRRWASRQVNP